MGRLIDTSVFIRFERGRLAWETLFQPGLDRLAVSAVTYSELGVGVHRTPADRQAKREQFVRRVLDEVEVLPFDQAVAHVHSRLAAALQAAGTKVGDHDLLIAATAIYHDLEVLSFDERSFPRVPGVRLAALP